MLVALLVLLLLGKFYHDFLRDLITLKQLDFLFLPNVCLCTFVIIIVVVYYFVQGNISEWLPDIGLCIRWWSSQRKNCRGFYLYYPWCLSSYDVAFFNLE